MNTTDKIFLEKFLDLVKLLDQTRTEEQIKEKLEVIGQAYREIEDKDHIFHTLDPMCNDLSDYYFMLLEYLFAATKDERVLKKELEVLKKGLVEDKIDPFFAIFYKWQIISRIFLTYNGDSLYVERRELHDILLNKMKQFLGLDLPFIEENQRNKDRVLVIASQLLGDKHGPTRNIMDYCYTLQKKLHKEVILLITLEVPTSNHPNFGMEGVSYSVFSHIEGFYGNRVIDYMGEKIHIYQCNVKKDSKEELSTVLKFIHNWKPFLVYDLGSENLMADICGSFTTQVSLPFSYEYPVSNAEFLILARKIAKKDEKIVNLIRKRHQKIIESIFVFKLEDPIEIHHKNEFGLSDDKFVIAIVGTRLSYEIDTNFIKVLRDVLSRDNTLHIVFFGQYPDFQEKKAQFGYTDRVHSLGFCNDLRGFLNIADIYLNPPRKGGGTSAVEAMAEGIPIITLPNCDVAYASGEYFICDCMEDFGELVLKYKEDRTFYDDQSRKAKVRASQLVNTQEVINGILTTIENRGE